MTAVKISVRTSTSGGGATYHTGDVDDCPILRQIEWREVDLDVLAGHYDECEFCQDEVGGGEIDHSYHQALDAADDWEDFSLGGGSA